MANVFLKIATAKANPEECYSPLQPLWRSKAPLDLTVRPAATPRGQRGCESGIIFVEFRKCFGRSIYFQESQA
jgi:hypothetical protein